MSDTESVDVETLQRDIEQIKDAMGLRDRYPTTARLWVVVGVLVAVASLSSQAISIEGWPDVWYPIVWFGLTGVGWVASVVLSDGRGRWAAPEGKPGIGFVFLAAFAGVFAVQAIVGPLFSGGSATPAAMRIFSLYVAMTGVAYLLVGNVLRAYRIRRRDRVAFYVGGVWILALGVSIPYVPVLRTWGYAAYGLTFLAHAIGSYLVLSGE